LTGVARATKETIIAAAGTIFLATIRGRPPMESTLTKTLVPVHELRQLLSSLADQRPDISVRFRLLGEMWMVHFLKTVKVTTHGAILYDDRTGLISVSDLSFVMQFEIDRRFQRFQPFYHYEVSPMLVARNGS